MSDSSEINSVDLQNNENNLKFACHELGEPENRMRKINLILHLLLCGYNFLTNHVRDMFFSFFQNVFVSVLHS